MHANRSFGNNRYAKDDDARIEPAQQKNDAVPPVSPEVLRRPPRSEDERSARDEAVRKEAWERTKALSPDDWEKRSDAIVEIAKREGFLPRLVRTHIWGQFRSTDPRVSLDEKLNAARRIAELARLFPDEIERYINRGELQLVNEVVRLVDEGETPPEQILRRAAQNVGYPDLRWVIGAIAGARAGRSTQGRESRPLTPEQLARKQQQIKENSTVGAHAEVQGTQIIARDIERLNLSTGRKKLVRVDGDGGTIPDLP